MTHRSGSWPGCYSLGERETDSLVSVLPALDDSDAAGEGAEAEGNAGGLEHLGGGQQVVWGDELAAPRSVEEAVDVREGHHAPAAAQRVLQEVRELPRQLDMESCACSRGMSRVAWYHLRAIPSAIQTAHALLREP